MSEVMEIQEDYNTPETSNRFNKGARHEDEDDHGNEQAYEDVEEQEYDDEEHEDHRNQEEEDDGEEHGEEEEEEDQHHDEDHNDQRELAKRQSSKRLVQNGLTQVQETVDENHHEEEEGEKDEDLINELKTLAGGDNPNKPQNKKKPSQGDKSPWDRKNWNQQFSFDQFSGAGSVLSPKVAPEDSHKHYQKFCVEFLDKREEGLQKKRQQKLEDELAVLQDKPKLIAKPLSKPHIPLLDRTPLMDARREKELQKVKEEQEEKKKRELEELTFAPKINPKSKKMTSPTKEHIMNMYLRTKSNYTATATASPPVTVNKKKSDRSFSPRINNNSRNIAETIRENSSDNVVDRLYHRANLGQGKREQLARDLTPTFSPRLNKNTRRIARQIEENYQNRSGSLNRNDDEGNLSDRRRLVTEGDAQNLDEEGDVELLNILKQFNTMLRQKNEAPISIEQLSSLMASYSSKNRGNSTSRPQNIQEQEDEEYETSQRQLQTDRPMRSNIDERRPDIEVNSSPYKKNIQTPRTQSKNFSSPKNPKAQPQAQSPTRSQSPGKKSGALLATLMQNPRHKNKTDDAPTTSINSNIVQRVLGGSPSRKGNTQKSSLSVSQGGKNATKNGSSQKKNTKGGKTASAKNGVVRNSDGQGVEKGAQASQKSPNFAEDNGSQEAGSKNALEGWYSSNQERKETEDEYVYRTQEEEERPKGHVANRLTTEDYEEEDRYGGSKREELFEDEQAEENNEAGEEQYYEEEEAEAQNREEEVQNNEGDGEEEHQEQQNYEDVANQDYQSQQANGENEENRDHEGQEVKDEERNEEQHTDREVQNQDDNSQKKAEEKLKRQSVYSSQGFYERNEQPQKKGKGRLSVQSSQGYYGRNDKQPGYPANVQGKDSRNYKSQNKIKGNESKQSVQEENKASQKSFDLTAGSQKSLIIHNDVSLEQGQLSKQNVKSSNSVQRENPRTKQHRDSAFKKKKESIDQAEEEQRYQIEQMTQSIQDSQQARPEDNVSFSENTIENHISFDEHQAPQTDHRLLEDLMSLGSKTFSVKPETPKKVSPKKPQIQFEVVTTETIQIEPPSVKKTNFSFSMDGTEIPVTSASGSELKQMAQHTVKKFKAYDAQIKQMASREYKVSVSPPKSNSKSPDEKKEMKPTSPRILTPKGPKVFKSIEKGGASKTPRSNITRSSVLKNSVQGSLSSVHSGKEGFLSKRGDLDRSGMSTKRK